MTIPFTHIHSSSRFDRSDASLRDAYNRYGKVAALITGTELEAHRRQQVVRKALGDEYGHVFGNKSYANDCAISYRHSRFELVYKENFKTTNVPYYNKRGDKKDSQYATIAVLKDKRTGMKFAVAVVHLAAGIEGLIREDQNTKATVNWFASFMGLKKKMNKINKRGDIAGVMIVADFNVDFKFKWAKNLMVRIAGGYTNTWYNTNVPGGTLANRIIDWTLLKGAIRSPKGAKLFKDDGSSDHRPYAEVLVIGRKKAKKRK